MKEYHVSKFGSDKNDGSVQHPFLTISKAAAIAEETDTVIVHEGVYRERVAPANGGRSDFHRIVYKSAEGERVVIKGSEVIDSWVNQGNNIWLATLDNEIFGDYNPYQQTISGDWLCFPFDPMLHTGQVYLDGAAMCEKGCTDELSAPMTWCCSVDESNTYIWANFGQQDPSQRLIEINVRMGCFYPNITGINYITVKGFEMAHAATPWTPPTAEQPGMIWTRWSKGWIIEDNLLHDSRCSAVSLGKEASTGHNISTRYNRKPGYRTQLETVFMARHVGWSKERIGSHTVRNNVIYDCGQNGIVGHLGGAFCQIYGNRIYNIGNRHEFVGWEIAAIKLHAAIDTYIHHNCLYNSVRGIWLDWQAQGTRVSSNAFFDNELDLFVEVTHGPHLIDNNLLLSEKSLLNHAQGGAFVHNLLCGSIVNEDVPLRATPYHLPHSTEIMGASVVYGNDDRFYQNIFAGTGTNQYNGCPNSFEVFQQRLLRHIAQNHDIDVCNYNKEKLPAYIGGNCYFGEAAPYESESENLVTQTPLTVKVSAEGEGLKVQIDCPLDPSVLSTKLIGTHNLAISYMTEQLFESADSTPIIIDTDYNGNPRSSSPTVGPFEQLKKGVNTFVLWQ